LPAGPLSAAERASGGGPLTAERPPAGGPLTAERPPVGGPPTVRDLPAGLPPQRAVEAIEGRRARREADAALADRGQTQIPDEVVEKVAITATRSIEGVYDFGGDVARVFDAVRDRSGLDHDADDDDAPGLRVDISGRRAVFDLTLVVRFGHLVPAVAAAVRSAVIESVEQTFGLDVVEVNIVVDDVYVDDSFPADAGR